MVSKCANRIFRVWIPVAVLVAVLAGGLSVSPAVARTSPASPPRADIERMVAEEAVRGGISASLALAVAKVESNFRADAESSAGARGVMQIMPKTGYDLYGVHPDELWDPRTNIQIGVDYLKSLISQYGGRWDLALSHYNGGSRVGTPPNAKVIPETQGYVDSVLAWQRRFERNETLVAMAGAVEGRDQMVHAAQDRQPDYWMFDAPGIVKDWRHYLKVADYWLNQGKPGASGSAAAGSSAPAADTTAPDAAAAAADAAAANDYDVPPAAARATPPVTPSGQDWPRVSADPASPSATLMQRFTARRLQFRDQLNSGSRPWRSRRSIGSAFGR